VNRWFTIPIFALSCTGGAPALGDSTAALQLAERVSQERVMTHVNALARGHADDVKLDCKQYPPESGVPSCELSRDAAVDYVQHAWKSYGLKVTARNIARDGEIAKNIEAEVKGETEPHEVVLVAAHLDAYFAGADDNSSGVAVLLELAKLASEVRFRRTLRFVAFDLEERGSVGSTRYVQHGFADDVAVALVLECLGYADDAAGSQESLTGLPLGDTADFLAVVGNEDSSVQTQQIVALNHVAGLLRVTGVIGGGDAIFPLSSALTRSDNGPLWLRGVPAVMFTDTADLRNPHYHEPTDTPDTLDAKFLGNSARLVVLAAAYFAGALP
jgi:Zn-dependent M28 family amino/carboxypeptidase